MSRYLRIAAAVVFALLGVAFVALWVRSYYHWDVISAGVGRHDVVIGSLRGVVGGTWVLFDFPDPPRWRLDSAVVSEKLRIAKKRPNWGFRMRIDAERLSLSFPHWFLALSSLSLAALFAFKRHWRFTVRGLLIATTVIAAMLGLVVYAV